MNNIVKVDMIPKSFGVRTLSCSQGDTKREFKFILNDGNGTIDTSDVEIALPQFPVYKGGTEQLLPENGSTPTTSPFKGDIRYPQGLLTDQEFTYRQSPTEEDGLAKITDIKGNTLVWNQLSKTTSDAGAISGLTRQVTNGLMTVSGTPTSASIQNRVTFGGLTIPQNHKVLIAGKSSHFYFRLQGSTSYTTKNGSTIFTAPSGLMNDIVLMADSLDTSTSYSESFYPQIFDLTQMFGSGNEPTSVEEFTSLFPLSYYDYNQGTLIPFSGNGIKTTGKNLLESANLQIGKNWAYGSASNRAIWEFDCEPNTKYHIDLDYPTTITNVVMVYKVGHVGSQISNTPYQTQKHIDITTPNGCNVVCIQFEGSANISASDIYTINRAYLYGDENITSLPISTYFPTGMKRAGNVYDELTDSKAVTRIGVVDLGTLTYALSATAGGGSRFSVGNNQITNIKPSVNNSTIMNAIFLYGEGVSQSNTYNNVQGASVSSTGILNIYIEDYKNYTVEQFKTAMNGVMLYYELATETETEITSASLVTENGEIQLLPQGDYLVGTVNSSVSRKSGMFDAKVKLTDGDGTVYSNKLQLYVERSPK